ncbi:MAG: mannose-6-phosphate isomerase [Chloroflexi bacterium]|nr:mannose-6-phosphate isomerase [Chloroflexota bacterium]
MANHPITQSPNHPIAIYPYILQPRLREMIWGGQNLARLLDKPIAPDQKIGETWEAWDECVIANGAQRGATLGDLLARDPAAILGADARDNRFPLLFKFIDAQDDLSVQVHPDDAQARALENYPFGKTEAWYILHAEPGARIVHGFKEDVDAARVRAALAANRLPALLASVPVQRGEVVFVPAGTVHAIMRGIVLAEIQENSDLTYRLDDWGRESAQRPLHVEPSLRVLNFARQIDHKISPLAIQRDEFDRRVLIACNYFALERWDLRAPSERLALNDKFNIISVLEGAAEIGSETSRVVASRGQTLVLPARLGAFGIAPRQTPCQLLRIYVPDLRADVIEPLTRAGHRADEIAKLIRA